MCVLHMHVCFVSTPVVFLCTPLSLSLSQTWGRGKGGGGQYTKCAKFHFKVVYDCCCLQWEKEHMQALVGINQRVVHQLTHRAPPLATHVELPE